MHGHSVLEQRGRGLAGSSGPTASRVSLRRLGRYEPEAADPPRFRRLTVAMSARPGAAVALFVRGAAAKGLALHPAPLFLDFAA